jgi:heptaprenylglyceryl phosphate synthase
MALNSGTTTVGTAATLIDGAAWHNPVVMHIHNNDNTDAIYLGGSDVTTTNGLSLLKQESLDITLYPGNQIYAVSSKSGHNISFIRQPL